MQEKNDAANATANVTTNATTDEDESTDVWLNSGISLITTMVMMVGELDYVGLKFQHWLGYVIFVIFLFSLVIVLMNILNGLAVSDINQIMESANIYSRKMALVSLASIKNLTMVAEELIIYPNTKPRRDKICGIPVPFRKGYMVKGGKMGKREFEDELFLKVEVVNNFKDVAVAIQKDKHDQNQDASKNIEGLNKKLDDLDLKLEEISNLLSKIK